MPHLFHHTSYYRGIFPFNRMIDPENSQRSQGAHLTLGCRVLTFIERLGERPLAVTNIGRSLYILLMIPGSALSTTVNTLVSNMIGEGHKERVIPFMMKILKIVLLILLPIMVFTFAFPELFARIYTNNPELVAATIPTLRVVSVAMVFCGLSSILFSVISGTGNTKSAFIIEFITLFFYIVYVYYTAVILRTPVEIA